MNPSIANCVFGIGRRKSGSIQLLGTGFSVGESQFATAAHVTGPADDELFIVLPTINNLEDYQDTTAAQVRLIEVKLGNYDPIRDIAILYPKDGAKLTFPYALGSADSARTGARIYAGLSTRRSWSIDFDGAAQLRGSTSDSKLARNQNKALSVERADATWSVWQPCFCE